MVYGRGFDSRRLHQHLLCVSPQEFPHRVDSCAAVSSSIPLHRSMLGVSLGVSSPTRHGRTAWIGVSARARRTSSAISECAFITATKKGKATAKQLSDGGSMYLTHTAAGSPVWQMTYRFRGKYRIYSIGPYPAVSLEAARAARDEAKALLREGRDPVTERRLERAAATAGEGRFASRGSRLPHVHQEAARQRVRERDRSRQEVAPSD